VSGVLVIAEHRQGALREVTAEIVSAAAALGAGPVAVAVVAGAPGPLADACAIEGVDEVIEVATGGPHFDSDVWRSAVAALVRERAPDVVVAAHSVDGMGFAPAVAAALGTGLATDVVALETAGDGITATRAPYGGKVAMTVQLPAGSVVLLRAATFPAAASGGSPQRTSFAAPAVSSRLQHLGFVEEPAGEVDITGADVIVSIGRGIGDRDNVELFERVAARLGATLASSRPLVDAGWMPHARQVGQSGTTVKPSVYVAFGISGAVQHLAGMKAARTIIAVNTDPQAPIFGVAHYGTTLDALDIAEAIADA
jgi:electron transfer flavoprotein alpha subunit